MNLEFLASKDFHTFRTRKKYEKALNSGIGLSDYYTYSYLSTIPLKRLFKNMLSSFNVFAKFLSIFSRFMLNLCRN